MFDLLKRKLIKKHAYTFTEMLVVIAIIAICTGIAIPAVTVLRRSMTLAQNNDYAKSIYMAVQSNLTQMRSLGELGMLETAAESDDAAWYKSSYQYTSSIDEDSLTYDLIVPSTLDPAIRNQQVIVEYHPKAGIVYAVFYYEGSKDLMDMYTNKNDNEEIRGEAGTEQGRKKKGVGYYCVGSEDAIVLEEQSFTVFQASTNISFANAQEGTIIIEVPIVDNTGNNMFPTAGNDLYNHFISNLEIKLTVDGENGGQYTEILTSKNADFEPDITNNQISVKISMDTLEKSFSQNVNNKKSDGTGNLIASGDNVTITAATSFVPVEDSDPLIIFGDSSLAGINPMFHSLTQNPNGSSTKPYILAVSNGRHLQNLTYLDRALAAKIDSIVFVQPESNQGIAPAATNLVLDWAETSSHYGSIDFIPIAPFQDGSVPKIEGNGVEIRNLTISSAVDNNTGLFAELSKTEIRNITLKNPNIVATDAESAGALIGTASDVKISNCTVSRSAENSAIRGKKNVGGLIGLTIGETSITHCSTSAVVAGIESTSSNIGGLVGLADGNTTIEHSQTDAVVTGAVGTPSNLGGLVGLSTSGTSITNCTTSADVSGTDNVASNLGGMVGAAEASILNHCNVQSAIITSGQDAGTDSTKNALGGLVGAAIPDVDAVGTTISNCFSDADTKVISAKGALSDLGGVVGYAEGATFTDCETKAYVSGTVTENKHKPIPNNNLGGFVGKSERSNYTDISVAITYLPQYAQDAGGFAGLLYGGKTNKVSIAISRHADGKETVNNFGGIASRCSRNAEITDVSVDINAVIDIASDNAGGAFFQLGLHDKIKLSNIRIDIEEIVSNNAAGFAVSAEGFVEISNSYVYGTITGSGNQAGFIYDICANNYHAANIQSCFANVDMNNGVAFVADNSGSIKNCYGWVWGDGNKIEIPGNCSYSYFVAAKDKSVTNLAFYESLSTDGTSAKSNKITDTAALADVWAVDLLNAGGSNSWKKVSEYPYPSLATNSHKPADKYTTPAEGSYPYALRYVETYRDGSTGDSLVYFSKTGEIQSVRIGSLKDDVDITSTSYYLCHRTSGSISTEVYKNHKSTDFEAELEKFALDGASGLFTIYRLTNDTNYSNLNLSTLYPLAYDNQQNQYYWLIRTAGQFANIAKKPDGVFYLDRSLEVGTTLETFSGCLKTTANKSVTITTKQTLINTLTGSLIEINAIGLKAPLIGTIAGGTVENCNITADISSSENSYLGVICSKMTDGSIIGSTTNGSVSGGDYVGGVVGLVSKGQISGVTSNVNVTATGTHSGMFVGYASGGSFSNCHATVNSTKLPFGVFSTEEITDANYESNRKLENGDLLYATDFDNFTAVEKQPSRITVPVNGCTIKDSTGTTRDALKGTDVHYYNINTSDIGFKIGKEYSIALSTPIVSYKDLHDLVGRNTNAPSGTPYYVLNSNTNSFERLYVATSTLYKDVGNTEPPTEAPTEASTEAPTEALSTLSFDETPELISEETTEEYYVFQFYTNPEQEPFTTIKITADNASLQGALNGALNGATLYAIDTTFDNIREGLYLLKAGDNYLVYNEPNVILTLDTSMEQKNYIWSKKSDAWYNHSNSDVSVVINTIDPTCTSFTNLATITSAYIGDPYIATNTLTAQYLLQYYGYTYLGTALDVYYPG